MRVFETRPVTPAKPFKQWTCPSTKPDFAEFGQESSIASIRRAPVTPLDLNACPDSARRLLTGTWPTGAGPANRHGDDE